MVIMMLRKVCFCLAIAVSTPLWSQVEPDATGGGLDDSHMMTPPPVSGDAYPVIVGAETRSNYLAGGLALTAGYSDNLMVAESAAPTSDEIYSILPTVSFDRRTPRHGESLSYSSGFTLYQNTGQLNGVSQSATGGYRFHISPYAVIVVQDQFRQNYNLYNQANPLAGGGIPGAPSPSNTVLIAPFANQLGNATSAAVEYQYGRNAMVGASGSYTIFRYSDLSTVPGLDNAGTASASAFFSRRLSRSQYVGATYQFSKIVTHPVATYTVTNAVFGFYTIYLTRNFSFSILGGPQHYTTWAPTVPKQEAWTPAVEGSFGWQTYRSNVVASYSHIVSGAGGLIGAYHANLAGLSARLTFARNWSIGTSGDYSQFSNATPAVFVNNTGGHTLSGSASLGHRITERVNAEAGYAHFHQSYPHIPIAAAFPDSNRVYGSITYQFARPIGR